MRSQKVIYHIEVLPELFEQQKNNNSSCYLRQFYGKPGNVEIERKTEKRATTKSHQMA